MRENSNMFSQSVYISRESILYSESLSYPKRTAKAFCVNYSDFVSGLWGRTFIKNSRSRSMASLLLPQSAPRLR